MKQIDELSELTPNQVDYILLRAKLLQKQMEKNDMTKKNKEIEQMTEPMQAPEEYNQAMQPTAGAMPFQLTPPPNFATGSIVAELKAEIEMLENRLSNRKAVLEIVLKNASPIEEFVAAWRQY